MFSVLKQLLGGSDKKKGSAQDASERLKFILVHDRAAVSPEVMEHLKNDIIKVISKYMDINPADMDISLASAEDSNALVVNVPIHSIAHNGKRV